MSNIDPTVYRYMAAATEMRHLARTDPNNAMGMPFSDFMADVGVNNAIVYGAGSGHPYTTQDLATLFDMPWTSADRIVKRLVRDGMVTREKKGRAVYLYPGPRFFKFVQPVLKGAIGRFMCGPCQKEQEAPPPV